MSGKTKKPNYEKPFFRDLSELAVKGQVSPEGQCMTGPTPYYNCSNGSGFIGACASGGTPDTSKCEAGAFHTQPACDSGSSAATICISGAGQNF